MSNVWRHQCGDAVQINQVVFGNIQEGLIRYLFPTQQSSLVLCLPPDMRIDACTTSMLEEPTREIEEPILVLYCTLMLLHHVCYTLFQAVHYSINTCISCYRFNITIYEKVKSLYQLLKLVQSNFLPVKYISYTQIVTLLQNRRGCLNLVYPFTTQPDRFRISVQNK